MAEPVDPSHLVGASEIAERLGIRHSETVNNWRQRYQDFPAPVATLQMGLVYDWTKVEAWARRTGRIV